MKNTGMALSEDNHVLEEENKNPITQDNSLKKEKKTRFFQQNDKNRHLTKEEKRQKKLERQLAKDKQKHAGKDKGKIVSIKRKSKKKKRILVCIFILIVVIGASGGVYYYIQGKSKVESVSYQSVKAQKGNLTLDLSESGTTAFDTTDQKPSFNATAVDMVVEEVYVSSGNTVKTGDKLLKLTDESYKKAVAYYEEKVTAATKALNTAKLNYNTGKLEAAYEKQTTQSAASTASDEYNTKVAALDQAVTLAQAQYDGTQQEITAYQTALSNNTYYTENDIAKKTQDVTDVKTAADNAQTTYNNAKAAYDSAVSAFSTSVTALSATSSSAANDISSLQSSYANVSSLSSQLQADQDALTKANQDLTKKQDTLDSATKAYNKSVSDANTQIDTLTKKLPDLQTALTDAKNSAVTQKATLQNDYDTNVTKGKYASSTYDSTVNTLADAISTAQATLNTLKTEQSALLAMSNGVISASSDGTIAAVNYKKGDTLTASKAFVSYYNKNTVKVSVEVPQADISKIAVGNSVGISVSGNRMGNLSGTVSSIATSATSGASKSNVTYSVVVSLDNSDGSLSSGSTAYATFSFGKLSDVLYVPINAISDTSGTSANVKQYDSKGNVVSIPVTIGDETDQYVVITKGLNEGDTCLIEAGGKSK